MIAGHVRCLNAGVPGSLAHLETESLAARDRAEIVALRAQYEHAVRHLVQRGIDSHTFVRADADASARAILGAVTLAVLVNIVELLCTAGLPALYTEVLASYQLPTWWNYAYLGLYISAYMFDDSLMVAVVVLTLRKRKLQETQGRWLKLLSGVVIMALGLVVLLQPEWLM